MKRSSERLLWVDTVEKGLTISPARNYRINEADFLNRYCAFDAGFDGVDAPCSAASMCHSVVVG
jgi:hypothetical protein